MQYYTRLCNIMHFYIIHFYAILYTYMQYYQVYVKYALFSSVCIICNIIMYYVLYAILSCFMHYLLFAICYTSLCIIVICNLCDIFMHYLSTDTSGIAYAILSVYLSHLLHKQSKKLCFCLCHLMPGGIGAINWLYMQKSLNLPIIYQKLF